jgi:hypothetical protein
VARGEVNQLPWWFTTRRRSDPIGWNAIQAEVFLTLGIDPCGLSWEHRQVEPPAVWFPGELLRSSRPILNSEVRVQSCFLDR